MADKILIKATAEVEEPTVDQIRAIKGRVRNLLLDFGHDINVIVEVSD